MRAWTLDEVAAGCGLSRHEISQWISRGQFRPSTRPPEGQRRLYDWRDVVRLAVVDQLRRVPIDTATALRCAGDDLRNHLAGYETLPPPPACWLLRDLDRDPRMSLEPAHAITEAASGARAILAVDVARVGWAALNRLAAARDVPA